MLKFRVLGLELRAQGFGVPEMEGIGCRDSLTPTHRPVSSSFLGLPCRILNIYHKKQLLKGLWVNPAHEKPCDHVTTL